MDSVIFAVVLLLAIAWPALVVRTTRIDEGETWAHRLRPVWFRVPEGYTGVVLGRRSTRVRPAGARFGRPFASLTLVSTAPFRRSFGPLRIAAPDGTELVASGTVLFHVVDPAAFATSPWRTSANALGNLLVVAIRGAAQDAGVDGRDHAGLFAAEAQRGITPYLAKGGLAVDNIELAVTAATAGDLAAIEKATAKASRPMRGQMRFAIGVLAALSLFFVGYGTWLVVDDLWLRPSEYAHLLQVGVASSVTVTTCGRNDCEGDYSYDGVARHGRIPDTGGLLGGTVMPILVDPADPTMFFPTEYVRSGRNAGLSPILFFGIAMVAAGCGLPLSMYRSTRMLGRRFAAPPGGS